MVGLALAEAAIRTVLLLLEETSRPKSASFTLRLTRMTDLVVIFLSFLFRFMLVWDPEELSENLVMVFLSLVTLPI